MHINQVSLLESLLKFRIFNINFTKQYLLHFLVNLIHPYNLDYEFRALRAHKTQISGEHTGRT